MDFFNSLPPKTLLYSRYQIEKTIGRGGSGFIYSAYDSVQNLRVAVKEIFPSSCCTRDSNRTDILLDSENAISQYNFYRAKGTQEAQILLDLCSCQNTPKFYDQFEENGTIYIVMELLNGCTLRKYLSVQVYPLSESETYYIAKEILSALMYVHKHNIVHRDVCCDNIFLTLDRRVLLIDFGATAQASRIQQEGTSIIRNGYSPPEQYKTGRALGPWTDLYALGAVLYESMTLKRVPDSRQRLLRDELVPLKEWNPQISSNLAYAIEKSLCLKENYRFQTAMEFLNCLQDGKFIGRRITRYLCAILLLIAIVVWCFTELLGEIM